MGSRNRRVLWLIPTAIVSTLGCEAPQSIDKAADVTVRRALTTSATAGLMIPTYYGEDDDDSWGQAVGASSATQFYILNPSDGPGTAFNPNFAGRSAYIHETGQLVLGYVLNSYNRSLDTIVDEIGHYIDWYRIDGVFFDVSERSTSTESDSSKTTWLANYVASQSGWNTANLIPVFNWGTIPPYKVVGCAIAASQLTKFVDFEDTESMFNAAASDFSSSDAQWLYTYPPDHFVQLIHTATSTSATSLLATVRARNAAFAYITERSLANHAWLYPASNASSPNVWDSETSTYAGQPTFSDFGGASSEPAAPSGCAWANTCSHDLCLASGTNDPLPASCDSCVDWICNSLPDAYCCMYDWDSQCVNEAVTFCSASCS